MESQSLELSHADLELRRGGGREGRGCFAYPARFSPWWAPGPSLNPPLIGHSMINTCPEI